MRYMIEKHDFERLVSKLVPEKFGPLGFSESEPGVFTRPVQAILHGFGFTLHRSYPQFCVPVGVIVPCLCPMIQYVMQGSYPALTISQRLGDLRNSPTGIEKWYSVSSNEKLSDALECVYKDFLEQAIPWLQQLSSLELVAREYFRRRIAPPSTGDKRAPDAFAWAVYGWMLSELGNIEESKDWLCRAVSELLRPTYVKNGRITDRHEAGSTQLQKTKEEDRLLELLAEFTP